MRDSRDLVYIFLSIVVGFAAGVQSLAVGAVISIVFNFVLLVTWHYDYGRNMLMPTAAAQWSRPLQALASPTGDHQVPDRDLILSLTPEKAEASKVLAANQGLYNGFLGAGLLWSLTQGRHALHLAMFFLICVAIAGFYGAWTANRKILYVQALPALIALVLIHLGMH